MAEFRMRNERSGGRKRVTKCTSHPNFVPLAINVPLDKKRKDFFFKWQ